MITAQLLRFGMVTTVALVAIYGIKYAVDYCASRFTENERRNVHTSGFTGDSIKNCGICLEGFSSSKYKKKLPCKHGFHTKCLKQVFQCSQTLCPFCREEIPDVIINNIMASSL